MSVKLSGLALEFELGTLTASKVRLLGRKWRRRQLEADLCACFAFDEEWPIHCSLRRRAIEFASTQIKVRRQGKYLAGVEFFPPPLQMVGPRGS